MDTPFKGIFRERFSKSAIHNQSSHSLGKSFGIAYRHKDSVIGIRCLSYSFGKFFDIFRKDFPWTRGAIGRDYRLSERHGFDDRETESFECARLDVSVRGRKDRKRIFEASDY